MRVDIAVGAQLLDQIDGGPEALPIAKLHMDVLGSHADRHLGAQGGELGALDRDDARAEIHAAIDDLGREDVHRRASDETRDEQVHGSPVEIARHADLLEEAVLQDRDPVPHRQCLDLVVRDVHGRGLEPPGERADLGPGLDA